AVFFTVFGAALAGAALFGAAWWRARTRLNQLEDRLAASLGSREAGNSSDVQDRIAELAQRVTQLGRGQEFVQQLLSGKRRLPSMGRSADSTPSSRTPLAPCGAAFYFAFSSRPAPISEDFRLDHVHAHRSSLRASVGPDVRYPDRADRAARWAYCVLQGPVEETSTLEVRDSIV